VWLSQAFGGTAKFTAVPGWDALAKLDRARISAPAVAVPSRRFRRVSMFYL
jgi:hypothetical protein